MPILGHPPWQCTADQLLFQGTFNTDKLAKSRHEAPRWLDKKFVIRPVGSALGVQRRRSGFLRHHQYCCCR